MKEMGNVTCNCNIEPFNEYFYRGCFYNCLLSVLKNYHKNITELLLNDTSRFVMREKAGNFYLTVDYSSYLPLPKLLYKMGILFSCYDVKKDSFKNMMIEQLALGKMIIIWADSYFLPYRLDYFQNMHCLVTILVYGYDDMEKNFLIVDTNDNQRLKYEKIKVNMKDLALAYNSIFNYGESESVISFMAFYNMKPYRNSTDINWKRWYMLGEKRGQSKQDVLHIIREFSNIMDREVKYQDLGKFSLWLKGLNEIVLAEEARCRVLTFLMGENDFKAVRERDILNQWRKVRSICVKADYMKQWDLNLCNKVVQYMESIYSKEKEELNKVN